MSGVVISYLPSASTLTGAEIVPVVQDGTTVKTTVNAWSYTPAGTGAVTTTIQSKLRETVSVKDFGAVGDGVTDDTAAIQAAIDYCATFAQWPTLIIPGKCLIASSVNIDRPVDTETSEFIILGQGPGAGFYTNSNVTMFTSTIAMTTAPVSEFVTFQNILFETSSVSNSSYVVSEKLLRIKFINCVFQIIRCVISTTYVQTYYFIECNLRNTANNFINSIGLYDVNFDSCIIELCNTIVRSIDTVTQRGTTGLRFISCLIEAQTQSIVNSQGITMDVIGCHLESNYSPMFNLFGGGEPNAAITAIGNYIFTGYTNTTGSINSGSSTLTVANGTGFSNGDSIIVVGAGVAGANLGTTISSGGGTTTLTLAASASTSVTNATVIGNMNNVFYYGPTKSVFSSGNNCFPGKLHTNAVQVTNLISNADTCLDINNNTILPSDATTYSVVNGCYRAGTSTIAWDDTSNQITKDTNGNFGIGLASNSAVRMAIKGKDQTSTAYAGAYYESAGNLIAAFRNDRQVMIPALQNFANDVAAAAGGISVGSLYRNGSVVQVRVT